MHKRISIRVALIKVWNLGITSNYMKLGLLMVILKVQSMANRYEYTKRNDTCPTSSTTLYCRQSNKIKHTLKKKLTDFDSLEILMSISYKSERRYSIF